MGLFNATYALSGQIDTEVVEGERLARHTSYRIGGKADLFITCHSYHALRRTIEVLAREQVPWVVIGTGSNLLVADTGSRGAGVTLGRRGHQCRALTYELKTRSRIECPRKGECSDLAQRESRTGGRHHAALAQGDGDSQVVHEHARLRVLGLRELLLGGAPALSARPRAHFIGNGEHLGSRRRCFDEVDAHRGMLGTLTGKQKRYATHADAPFRTCSAP